MITRDNYEEFFLLYMDNELPVADRELVEQFVAENTDLGEEWEALLQCRIQPDHGEQPVFGHKELLMKFEDTARFGDAGRAGDAGQINDGNYEDYFLSYVDGELNERDRAAVEAFVRQHPSKELDLERLRQTISRPDPAITFPDKKGLYKERAGRRLLISPWWRMAAAAVVLGAVALLFFYHPAKEGQSLANNKKEEVVVTPPTPPALYSSGDSALLAAADRTGKKKMNDAARQKVMAKAEPALAQNTPVKTIPASTGGNQLPAEIAGRLPGEIAGRLPGEIAGLSGETTQQIAATKKLSGSERIAIVAPDPGVLPGPGRTVDAIDRAVAAQEAVIPKEKSSFATQALLNNATASREDDDIFEAEPASTKKNKFRGIFRRVSRAFEKTAGREDDGQRKVLIGAFQIALK